MPASAATPISDGGGGGGGGSGSGEVSDSVKLAVPPALAFTPSFQVPVTVALKLIFSGLAVAELALATSVPPGLYRFRLRLAAALSQSSTAAIAPGCSTVNVNVFQSAPPEVTVPL